MFGTKPKTPAVVSLDDKITSAKYDCIYQALSDVVKIKVMTTVNGKEEVDCARTLSEIKTRARLSLDFVSKLDKPNGDN